MKPHFNHIFLLFFASLFLSNCQKENISLSKNAKDQFFLKNNGAEMPVWVEGNTASKTFVIFLHGGPGGSSVGYNELNLFSSLEEKYAVAYWDQRCAGASQGNCNPNNLTVDAYVQDLDKLIAVLKSRYGQNLSLFLLGDSWGGTLATAYMTTGSLQQNLKGSIITVGCHNFPLFMQERQAMLNYYADQQIALGNRVADWEKIKTDIVGIDLTSINSLDLLQTHANAAQEYLTEIDSIETIELGNGKPNSLFFGIILNGNVTANAMWTQLLNLDLSPKLDHITTPTALYFGKFDFIVPSAVGVDYYNKLTCPKELYIFENSDHNLGISNGNDLYYSKIINFIETYK